MLDDLNLLNVKQRIQLNVLSLIYCESSKEPSSRPVISLIVVQLFPCYSRRSQPMFVIKSTSATASPHYGYSKIAKEAND